MSHMVHATPRSKNNVLTFWSFSVCFFWWIFCFRAIDLDTGHEGIFFMLIKALYAGDIKREIKKVHFEGCDSLFVKKQIHYFEDFARCRTSLFWDCHAGIVVTMSFRYRTAVTAVLQWIGLYGNGETTAGLYVLCCGCFILGIVVVIWFARTSDASTARQRVADVELTLSHLRSCLQSYWHPELTRCVVDICCT